MQEGAHGETGEDRLMEMSEDKVIHSLTHSFIHSQAEGPAVGVQDHSILPVAAQGWEGRRVAETASGSPPQFCPAPLLGPSP